MESGWLVLLDALGSDGFQALERFEDELDAALSTAGVGEVDGHGFGEDGVEVFIYCDDCAAARPLLEARLRASPFPTWTISPLGDRADAVEPAVDKELPVMKVRPLTAPPSWLVDTMYEVEACGPGTVDGVRLMGIIDATEPDASLGRDSSPGKHSPVVAVMEPSPLRDGSFDPWVVLGPNVAYESICLPDWLLTAPPSGMCFVEQARRRMLHTTEAAEVRYRRELRDLTGRTDMYLGELWELDMPGTVTWWQDNAWAGSTPFDTGAALVAMLTTVGRNRAHLIHGLRTTSGAWSHWLDGADEAVDDHDEN